MNPNPDGDAFHHQHQLDTLVPVVRLRLCVPVLQISHAQYLPVVHLPHERRDVGGQPRPVVVMDRAALSSPRYLDRGETLYVPFVLVAQVLVGVAVNLSTSSLSVVIVVVVAVAAVKLQQ